jgi:hypothetical protein
LFNATVPQRKKLEIGEIPPSAAAPLAPINMKLEQNAATKFGKYILRTQSIT